MLLLNYKPLLLMCHFLFFVSSQFHRMEQENLTALAVSTFQWLKFTPAQIPCLRPRATQQPKDTPTPSITTYVRSDRKWAGHVRLSPPPRRKRKTHPSVGKMGILRSGNLWSDDSVSMSWFRAPPTAYRHDDITSTITDICTKGLWVTVVSWMKWTEMDLNRIC